jgi:hypothetical protein
VSACWERDESCSHKSIGSDTKVRAILKVEVSLVVGQAIRVVATQGPKNVDGEPEGASSSSTDSELF